MPADSPADGKTLAKDHCGCQKPQKMAADAFSAFEKYKVIESNPPCGCPMGCVAHCMGGRGFAAVSSPSLGDVFVLRSSLLPTWGPVVSFVVCPPLLWFLSLSCLPSVPREWSCLVFWSSLHPGVLVPPSGCLVATVTAQLPCLHAGGVVTLCYPSVILTAVVFLTTLLRPGFVSVCFKVSG